MKGVEMTQHNPAPWWKGIVPEEPAIASAGAFTAASGRWLRPSQDDTLRGTVKQDRAVRTVAALDDAIRQLLRDPDVGRDRFTTAQVAKLSGLSIGTVYRYFPDRIAMLDRVWPDRPGNYLPDEQPPATE